MDRAAEIFFDHFGLNPGRSRGDIERIAETFSRLPWENLTKFLVKASGIQRPRCAETVMEEHASMGAGGTCYSLTETLGSIIKACGLNARPLTGHMNHGRNIHCALLVEGEAGTFLMDPGYVVPGAVCLDSSQKGELSLQGRLLSWKPNGTGWDMFTVENGREQHRYTLESRILSRDEYIGYWIRSFNATGLNSLHLNKSDGSSGRISAHNENLRVVTPGNRSNVKVGSDYAKQIEARFGISTGIGLKAWNELQRQRRERI